jgi:hypothetical protein
VTQPGYDREAERRLMRSIRDDCGEAIVEACGGDEALTTLVAAIAANESGGSRRGFRFAPPNYVRLTALLAGAEAKFDGVTRVQLEKRLSAAPTESERAALLKQLAGLHGYTQIAGYRSIAWKIPLDALWEKKKHFEFAVELLRGYCGEFGLEPARHALELGRCWSAGHPSGVPASALYTWRLTERMRLYRDLVCHRL